MHGTETKKYSKRSAHIDTSTNKKIAFKITWTNKSLFLSGEHSLQFQPLERGENECAVNPIFWPFINFNLFNLL